MIESNQLSNFVNMEKWIPLWTKLVLEEKERLFYPENIALMDALSANNDQVF